MKRKMPFIAALSILCWGCSSYDYSGDDIVGVKAAISGTITEVVEKSRTVGTTWTDGDRIGVTCEDDVNISYKYTGNLSSFAISLFISWENRNMYCPPIIHLRRLPLWLPIV